MVRRVSDMFKPGQLVRSVFTKRNFTVESVEGSLVMVKPAWDCWNKQPFLISQYALKLIGNNYQPKPNTPAR